jgi:hypothetical protein
MIFIGENGYKINMFIFKQFFCLSDDIKYIVLNKKNFKINKWIVGHD